MNVMDVMPSPLLVPIAGSQASASNFVAAVLVIMVPSLGGTMISRCVTVGTIKVRVVVFVSPALVSTVTSKV